MEPEDMANMSEGDLDDKVKELQTFQRQVSELYEGRQQQKKAKEEAAWREKRSLDERMGAASQLKAKATAQYKLGDVAAASKLYERALQALRQTDTRDAQKFEQEAKRRGVRLDLDNGQLARAGLKGVDADAVYR